MLKEHYYSLHKTSSYKPLLMAGGLGTALGGLYGLGDEDHNYYNQVLHPSTGLRAGQGFLGGAAGMAGYKALRGMGKGRIGSGLLGLLSAAGTAALLNPELKKENPNRLPF